MNGCCAGLGYAGVPSPSAVVAASQSSSVGVGAIVDHVPASSVAAGMYGAAGGGGVGGGPAIQYVLEGGGGGPALHHTIYSTSTAEQAMHYDYGQMPGGAYSNLAAGYHYIGAGSGAMHEAMTHMGAVTTSSAIGGLTSLSAHCSQAHQGGGGNAFFVDDGVVKIDISDGAAFSATTRASPATVQWLLDNYETCDGTSLPRSTLYTHYLQHCYEHKHEPMNPASFGKLIRSVFLGLRTRRLGTRGNSKYHYYGIRVKSTSALHHSLPDDVGIAARQSVALPRRPVAAASAKSGSVSSSDDSSSGRPQERPGSVAGGGATAGSAASPASGAGAAAAASVPNGSTSGASCPTEPQQQYRDFLGSPPENFLLGVSLQDPTSIPLPDGISLDHVLLFERQYKEHCKVVLDAVLCLKLPTIETLWQQFWHLATSSSDAQHQSGSVASETSSDHLGVSKLGAVCSWPPALDFIRQCDYAFYQIIVGILVPDVLRPIPSGLTQTIRSFAKNLENWLTSAMLGLPDVVIRTKASAAAALAQMLRRYTSLNHLAQAARAVLQNSVHLEQMLADLNRVDFSNIQEQASWVCQCDDATVMQLQQDMKQCLQQQQSLEEWADWLEEVVVDVLKLHDTTPAAAAGGSRNGNGCGSSSAGSDLPRVARLFLLKWSFYSSMIIRDLTLRSAASFGSFHLIRLLFDEYMFYIVEHRVADALNDTPIAIMGKLNDLTSVGMMAAFGTSGAVSAPSPPSTPPPCTAVSNGSSRAFACGSGSDAAANGAAGGCAAAGLLLAAGSAGFGSVTAPSKVTADSEVTAKKAKYI